MFIVKHNVTDRGMGNRHCIIILCFLLIVAITGIYIFYVCTYGNLGVNASKIKSSAARVDKTVRNLSKPFAKTTLIRIQKTFSNIYKEFRHQKKQMSGKSVHPSGTTQETYLSCSSRLFLLILVPSRPNAVLNRIAIRLSWAQNFMLSKKENIIGSFIYQVVFVIKKHVHTEENGNLIQESRKFGDILQVEHGSENLMVISAIERLLERKCKPEFLLMLTDDKTYVNVPEIVSWLSELNLKVKNKGNIKQNMATGVKYLSNTSSNVITFRGGAYILSGKILNKFLYATRIIPPSNDDKNEAMYVKTLAKSLGMTLHNNAGFVSHMFEDLNIPDIDPCAIKKEVFVNDVFRARHILLYAKMIIAGEKPCVNKAF